MACAEMPSDLLLLSHSAVVPKRPLWQGCEAKVKKSVRYLGKIVGAAVGAIAGPVGAIVGAWVGHQYDSQTQPSQPLGTYSFFDLCFAVMGYLAKRDGRVSEQEIAAARRTMTLLRLDEWHTRSAMQAFTAGKNGDWPIDGLLSALGWLFQDRPELRGIFFELQFAAMLWGNELSQPVRTELWRIACQFGVSAQEFTHWEQWVRSEAQPSSQAPNDRQRIQLAYQTLNIDASASDAELKKAYRRLMSENHPDKLVSKGLPESMLEVAKQKTQRIREAYDCLCEHRQIR
jgi:DnaJ like chaperone protein